MAVRLLIIGRSGQFARALAATGEARHEMVFRGRGEIDFSLEALARTIGAVAPEAIINAAAFTDVDAAERDEAAAFALNCDAPHALAKAAARLDLPLVHISTDYVFDGTKGAPYVERDAAAPINAYGRSKAAGDARVLGAGARAAILRTSWLFSLYGDNFATRLLARAANQSALDVVADQIGTPTYCGDLARACLVCVDRLRARAKEAEGVFHFANRGAASRAEFAEALMAEAAARGLSHARIERTLTNRAPGAAARPPDSRLDHSLFEATFGWKPRTWRDALSACFADIG